jgi:tellurite resistance protein TerC
VYFAEGHQRALEFVTAYLLEESLSVDNMFVFVLIFQFFRTPNASQPSILKWGILGAIFMRLILIFTGVSLLARFHWIMYVFGILLIVTAIKMVMQDEKTVRPDENVVLKIIQKFTSVTPFMAALIVIEASDLLFALDSIPAVLAVSNDPFIIFTSNVFAILGLRALFFVVSGFLNLFRYLKYGLGVILAFIGVKMLLMDTFPIATSTSLGIVALCLSVSVACSVLIKSRHE